MKPPTIFILLAQTYESLISIFQKDSHGMYYSCKVMHPKLYMQYNAGLDRPYYKVMLSLS